MEKLLTTEDIMQRYQVKSRTTVYEIMRAIGILKVGIRVYVRENDVEKYEKTLMERR